MQRSTRRQLFGFAAFVAVAILWTIVHERYGQTEGFRMWGIGLLVISVMLSFRKEIPVHLGSREVALLSGWRKAYGLVPAYSIGILVSLFPHAVACSVHLKGYQCS